MHACTHAFSIRRMCLHLRLKQSRWVGGDGKPLSNTPSNIATVTSLSSCSRPPKFLSEHHRWALAAVARATNGLAVRNQTLAWAAPREGGSGRVRMKPHVVVAFC